MPASIPYLVSPGSIKTALEKISQAATPERVTVDFVQTKLGIKGGTGGALLPFLKKIGMVGSDGAPTDLYKQYRNKTTSAESVAKAIKIGYKKLSERNEYFYELNDKDLQSLIVEVTGEESGSAVVKYALSTLRTLKQLANFEPQSEEKSEVKSASSNIVKQPKDSSQGSPAGQQSGIGVNLSYTINLNLPATSDQAVFNAIFRSLKEFLITNAK
jgi:hypothetical protein